VLDPVVVERSPQRERLLRLEAGLASLSD
jgi:hypothetical protein